VDADFDAIVVGAGPAGSVAAYSLAVAGLNVLMIERGTAPGSKNVTGGRLYAHALERVIPGFAGEAPLERLVTRETITFLTDESAVSVDVASDKLLKTPSYTVLRAEFDAWLAARAEAAGATLVTSIRADEPILEGGKVVGVRCGEDSMGASVVIAADGANSLIARKAGLRRELDPSEMATGVKCVLELPRGVIEERFNLDEGGGAAHLYVGECTKGMPGGGFLYTNKESLSIGLVVQAAALARSPHRLVDLVEDFRLHPRLGALVKDGRLVEYSAHLIPEAGLAGMASPVADGLLVVGDAAGLVLNTGYTLRGMDFAMASGAAAAEAVIEAAKVGNFSKAGLGSYVDKLNRSFVMRDLRTFKKAPRFLHNKRIYSDYPGLVEDVATHVFAVDGSPRLPLRKVAARAVGAHGGLRQLAKDGWRGMTSL
jgi:electron transfer flavoprotein-quinone oxidoreductase